MKLEDLQANSSVGGILSDEIVTVVNVRWFGSKALELTYKTVTGKVANGILYRHDEGRLELVNTNRPWSFEGDGAKFRLVSEAQRIRLAHLFDPLLTPRKVNANKRRFTSTNALMPTSSLPNRRSQPPSMSALGKRRNPSSLRNALSSRR